MYKFENIRIEAEFETSVIFANNPFDGVLAYLYAQELKSAGEYEKYEYERLELPFVKKTGDIYHTSCPIVKDNDAFIENNTIIKAFAKKLNKQIGAKPNMNIDVGRGKFKSDVVNFERQLIKKIEWYLCADYETVKKLLQGFTHFGKKSSLNFGKIKNLTIEKIDKDYSLISKDEKPNRPLPLQYFSNVENGKKVMTKAIYPYWERFGIEECYV